MASYARQWLWFFGDVAVSLSHAVRSACHTALLHRLMCYCQGFCFSTGQSLNSIKPLQRAACMPLSPFSQEVAAW